MKKFIKHHPFKIYIMEILKEFFDKKIVIVMQIFLNNPEKNFTITEISKRTGLGTATSFRIIKKLNSKKFLKKILIGKTKLYTIENNDKIKYFNRLNKKENKLLEMLYETILNETKVKVCFVN